MFEAYSTNGYCNFRPAMTCNQFMSNPRSCAFHTAYRLWR